MDAPAGWADNDSIVVIVHIYRKMKMKTTAMNQSFCTTQNHGARQVVNSVFAKALNTLRFYATRWIRRYRLRQSLYEMDTQLVEKDIGVPYGSLSEEAHKPFWRK